jgi:DNA-binding transcriptional regulator YiaG
MVMTNRDASIKPQADPNEIRGVRLRRRLSQPQFAA